MTQLKRFGRQLVLVALLAIAAIPALSPQAQAGPMSDYLEAEFIKYWFQNTAGAAKPATLYVGLSTAACSDSGFGTEVTGGSYARVAMTANSTNWPGPTANNGTVTNGAAVTFPAPSANWGVVTHWFIADASTSGNQLWCAPLTVSKTVNNGDAAPSFGIGALSIQVDN